MSADNGVYILKTPTDSGYEYRVQELGAVENVSWDDEKHRETCDPDIHIQNARRMWQGCEPFTSKGEALEDASDLYESLDICEYGISYITIDRKF